MWNNLGQYAKGVVIVAGTVITSLAPYYGDKPWFIGISGGLTAVAAILVPNSKADDTPNAVPQKRPLLLPQRPTVYIEANPAY